MDLFKDNEPLYLSLKFTIRLPPTAHKETQFNMNGWAYTNNEKKAWMIKAANECRKYEGWFKHSKFLSLKVIFHCERPKQVPINGFISKQQWNDYEAEWMKRSRPDLDNYEKSLQDILSHSVIQREQISKENLKVIKKQIRGAGIVEDDSLFVTKTTHKIYAKRNTEPRIEITIKERGSLFKRQRNKKRK